ncbi:MAG: acyl-CoA desaturase [Bdellovibrionota bacterium]
MQTSPSDDAPSPGLKTASNETLADGGKLTFAGDNKFHQELKRRVEEYFERTGLSPRGGWAIYFKTAVILLWFTGSYAFLVFAPVAWWQGLLLSFSLAFAITGVGFGIQHDANHGAYSDHGALNRLMGLTLDMLGASSGVWHWKHNIFHHTYTNLHGKDADIDIAPFGRLSPAQPRRRFYRFQQFYLWALYGVLYPKWHLYDDFRDVAIGRIAGNRFPRPRGWRLAEMIAGKLLFLGWAFAIPLLFHPWWVVGLFYAVTSFVVGLTLAVAFQLAHCVEETDFPQLQPQAARVPNPWAVHQVQCSADFAPRNRLLTWYLGGLNFQIEHHLFPKICHVHYSRISGIVQSVCAEFGVRYAVHKGFFQALGSHWRWLRRMGRPAA